MPVSRSVMAKRKGRFAVISFNGGGPLTGKPSAVAAAASVPFSSTVTFALWTASPMNRGASLVMPLKSAFPPSKGVVIPIERSKGSRSDFVS